MNTTLEVSAGWIRDGLVRTGICKLVFKLNPCALGVRRVGRAIDCHPRRKPDLN